MTGHLLLHYQHSCRSFVDKLNEVQVDSNTGKSYSEPKQSALDMRAKSILCPTAHVELTRSQAAIEYVWKEDTRIEGTQFELGHRAPRRNVSADWEHIWDNAVLGKLENVPPIYVYAVIINCEELGRTIYNRLEFSKLSWFTVSVVTGLIPGEPAFASSSVAPVNHDSSENSSRLYVIRPNSSQLIITAYTYIWGNICKVSQYGITPN
ncbi:hypothetical protein QVD99_000112 [Batrachochytrium dendrobatidis]|nr:hypothetical protein QVD99_000112 [Batrachochytrium dendrobatidis]